MKNIPYLEIFKEGLLIVWKNKFLWFFGLMVVIASIVPNIDNIFSQQDDQYFLFNAFFQKNQKLITIASLFLTLASFIFFFLKTLSIIAITKSLNNLGLYRQLKISTILKDSMSFLWRALLADIIVGFALFVLFVVLLVPIVYLFSVGAQVFAIIISIFALLIFLCMLFLGFYLHKYAIFYIVLVNKKIKEAFQFASDLFLVNVGDEVRMIFYCSCVAIFFALVVILVILFFGLIGLFFIVLSDFLFSKDVIFYTLFTAGLVGILFFVFISSLYVVFLQSIWLWFFKYISSERIVSDAILKKNKIDDIMTEQEIA